MVHVTFKQG